MKVRSTVILLALISAVAVAAEKADTDQPSTPNSVPMGPGYGMGPGMMMGPGMGMGPGMMGRGGPGMMWGAPNEAMQERWTQMQKNMQELQKNTDPEKQQQLMRQMWQMMHGAPGGPGMMHPGMMYPGMMGWQAGPMMGQGGWNWMMAMEQRMRRVEQMLNELLEQEGQPNPGQEKK